MSPDFTIAGLPSCKPAAIDPEGTLRGGPDLLCLVIGKHRGAGGLSGRPTLVEDKHFQVSSERRVIFKVWKYITWHRGERTGPGQQMVIAVGNPDKTQAESPGEVPRCQGAKARVGPPSASSPSSQPLLPCRWTFHTKQALRTLVHTRHDNFHNSVGSIDPSLALEGTSHCHTKKKKKRHKSSYSVCFSLTPIAPSLAPSPPRRHNWSDFRPHHPSSFVSSHPCQHRRPSSAGTIVALTQ